MKKLNPQLATCTRRIVGSLFIGLLAGPPAVASITVARSPLSLSSPSQVSGTGTIDSVMQAAANYYNDVFDNQVTLRVDYGWAPLVDLATSSSGNNVLFSNTEKWFLDGTPFRHEEFLYEQPASANFGGGLMTTGRALASDPSFASVADRYDLFSVALHEMGHILGFRDLPAGTFTLSSGPFAGATFPIDNDSDGTHFSNSGPISLANSMMTARPAIGGRYLPSAADIAVLADLRGLPSTTDFEAGYFAGSVSLSNLVEAPIGDGWPGVGAVTVQGPLSGLALTDMPSKFMGTLTATDRGSIDLVNAILGVTGGESSLSDGAKLRLANSAIQFKSLQANGAKIELIDSAIRTSPRQPPGFPQTVLRFTGSEISGGGTAVLDALDVALRIIDTRVSGNLEIRGTDVLIDGANSELDPGFSPGVMRFTGNVRMKSGVMELERLAAGMDEIVISGAFRIAADARVHLFVDSSSPFELALEEFISGQLPIFEEGFSNWDGLSIFSSDPGLTGLSYTITFQGLRKIIVAQFIDSSSEGQQLSTPSSLALAILALGVLLWNGSRADLKVHNSRNTLFGGWRLAAGGWRLAAGG